MPMIINGFSVCNQKQRLQPYALDWHGNKRITRLFTLLSALTTVDELVESGGSLQ